MPSEFHNPESPPPPYPSEFPGVFSAVHFRLGNVYMNKRTWIYAFPRRQALLFSDKKNLLTACGQAVQPFFKSKLGYKKHHFCRSFSNFLPLCFLVLFRHSQSKIAQKTVNICQHLKRLKIPLSLRSFLVGSLHMSCSAHEKCSQPICSVHEMYQEKRSGITYVIYSII